jgi:hypothetical protein
VGVARKFVYFPQQRLNFRPDLQEQGALRPGWGVTRMGCGLAGSGAGTNETVMRVTLIRGDENMRDFWVGGQGGRLG